MSKEMPSAGLTAKQPALVGGAAVSHSVSGVKHRERERESVQHFKLKCVLFQNYIMTNIMMITNILIKIS